MAENRVFLRAYARSAPFARRRLVLVLAAAFLAIPLFPSVLSPIEAAPMTLSFEATTAQVVTLGTLASRSRCGALTKQGVGPYTMTGTDSLSGLPYSYVTNTNYAGAGLRESGEGTPSMSFTRTTGVTYSGKAGVVQLNSSGTVSWSNTCNGYTVYGSIFGPQVYTAAFAATAGQALSFNWAAAGGGDDYEVYAYLVKVSESGGSYDYGGSGATLLANTTLLAHGRGTTQAWKTSTGSIPSDGYYRFRFVNGSYDASGGKALGANMYIDPNVLVGQANTITFGALGDIVTAGANQTFTVTATTTSGGTVNFSSSTTGKCTVGSSTLSGTTSTATVTVLANQTGLCTISADSASTGDYATAATVTRSFTILAAPTAPTNSGGTSVSGAATVGSTLTAVEGSWADGGSAVTGTTYQWQVCPNPVSCSWSNVSGATGSTYAIASGDVGKQLRVTVTKTNGIGSTSVNSTASSTVAKGNQSTLVVTSTSATYGETLSLSSSGGSGTGAVTWSVVSGTCSVSGATLTVGDAGSECVVSATKASDTSYNAATSANTTVTIGKANQTALTVVTNSGTVGIPVSLVASGGSGTGAVSWSVVSGGCSVSGSTLTPTAAGYGCTVMATKAGDTNYNAVNSVASSLNIGKGNQSVLTVSSTSVTYGQTLALASSGGSGTGAVTWSVTSGTCSVSGSTLTPGDAGSICAVTAAKAGDDDYFATTSSSTSITIGKANQATLTVVSTSATFGQNLALTTTGGSGNGAVSWSVVLGTCTVSGSVLTPGAVGSTCVVRASKATDTNYNQTVSANTTITISRASQSGLTVTSASSFTTGSSLLLTATGGQSSGALSWSLTSGNCSLSGVTLTASRGGISCTVEVTRAGDPNYLSAVDSQTVTVNKIAQNLTFRSTPPSPATPGSTYTVSVESDAFLAPTIAVANSSLSVCSVAAGVVTFSAVGSCVISASQAGNDVYSWAAASQTVNVVAVAAAAPVVTTPAVSVPVAPASSVAPVVEATTTTVPSVKSAVVTTTTEAPVVTTTTTTTTTIPADPGQPVVGVDGEVTELAAGETFAIVRGQKVDAKIDQVNDALVITLPNEVKIKIGPLTASSDSAKVSADGILRVFNNQSVDVSSEGLVPGTTYTIFMFSDPVELGRGSASADGRVSTSVLIPKDAKAEQHTLQLNGVGKGGEVVSVSLGFKIVERQNNTRIAVLAISLGMLLALLGGRPIFRRRRGIR